MEELERPTSSLDSPVTSSPRSINKTLGVDFLQTEKFIKEHGQEVQFYIWDTAGQEEYDALTRKYYKGASACILAYSTEDEKSFQNVKKWREKVDNE